MARVITNDVSQDLRPLKDRLATIKDLHSAAAVLAWDRRQEVVPERPRELQIRPTSAAVPLAMHSEAETRKAESEA